MTGPLVLAVGVIGFGLLTMLVAYALVNGALEREIRAVRAGHYAREIGYRRYMASSVTIVRYGVSIALLVPLIGAIVAPLLVPMAQGDNMNLLATFFGVAPLDRLIGYTFGYTVALVGALFTIPLGAYDLLTARLGTRALAELRSISLDGRTAFTYRLKRALVVFAPVFVVTEATGAMAFINLGAAVVVLAFGLIGGSILRRAFATHLMLWTTPSQPIEQTQWAALGTRIHEWGRLRGVGVKAIYVRETGRLGMGPIAAVGPWRARVLFIGDVLLLNTDWRQLDALVVYVLTTNAAGIARRNQRARRLISLGALVIALGITGALALAGQSNTEFPLVATIVLLLASLALLLGLVVLLGFSIFSVIFSRQRLRMRFIAADARVAALTGDPLGLLVALNTLSALSGAPTDRRIGVFPSTAERVAALDALLRQPGPRVPYAGQPVPSTVPVYVGPYCLTVPLGSAAQAAPAPVPTGPLPVMMPPVAMPMSTPMPASVPVPVAPPPAPPS